MPIVNKFRAGFQLLKHQGLVYVIYRIYYELLRMSGVLKFFFPSPNKVSKFVTIDEWKELNIPFIFIPSELLSFPKIKYPDLVTRKNRILNGEVEYFNKEWKQVSDWFLNPDTGYNYKSDKHWTQIKDIDPLAGDIKYVWEKSRFTYLIDIMRYDYHFIDDHSEFVFKEIENWISNNPINLGPNYKCSQEISLRCFNWIFLLYYYRNSDNLTNRRWELIFNSMYWQIKHVYSNINFSRICVRNNHSISECLLLYLAGLQFPFLKESFKWRRKGKKWLEKEIIYQVYDDGTFLQFSHNYQRVLVQLLTLFVSISKVHKEAISEPVELKLQALLIYMVSCCVGKDGEMPNYGNNDGALFFRFNNRPYTDFRPQINALHKVICGGFFYDDVDVKEDGYWYSQNLNLNESITNLNVAAEGKLKSYRDGGIYLIDDESDGTFTFFKCTGYRDRPGQADNMHLDIWSDGVNYLRDSGTYKYNTEPELINYFAGTEGHNAVIIEGHNQMTKGPRFIWYDWTKDASCEIKKSDAQYSIKAKARMFYSLERPVDHERKIIKRPNRQWEVLDEVYNKKNGASMKQLWHINPDCIGKIKFKAKDEFGNTIVVKKTSGYWSDYYGYKEDAPFWYFETTSNKISTEIQISTD